MHNSIPLSHHAGIYTTNSQDACRHIVNHANATIVVVEDVAQLRKFTAIRDSMPQVLAYVVYRPYRDAGVATAPPVATTTPMPPAVVGAPAAATATGTGLSATDASGATAVTVAAPTAASAANPFSATVEGAKASRIFTWAQFMSLGEAGGDAGAALQAELDARIAKQRPEGESNARVMEMPW